MLKSAKQISLAFAFVVLAISVTESAIAQDSDPKSVMPAWDAAFNAGDVDALMALYASDSLSMPPGRPPMDNAALRADYEGLFADYSAEHVSTFVSGHAEGKTFVEYGGYTMKATPKGDAEPFSEEGKHVIVLSQQSDGTWKILWEIWNLNSTPGG
jgi:ketosteroid isomerase-like protein